MATAAVALPTPTQQRIAPIWHTAGLLLLLAVPIIAGIYRRPENYASHTVAFWRFSIPALIYEWCLAGYVCWGLRRGGTTTLRQLIGGSWARKRDVFRDLALGIGFLVIAMLCVGLMIRLLGGVQAKGINMILPRGLVEMVMWLLLAVTAGFVEELVYRGYLQTQLARLGIPMALAVVAQAAIFGAGHSYQGMKMVVTITVFGIFAGAVAIWRRSLRPNMFGHAMMDILAALARWA